MNAVQVFVTLYCATLAATIALCHGDQLRWLRLTRGFERTGAVLGRWRLPHLSDTQFHLLGALLVLCLVSAAANVVPRAALLSAAILYFPYFGQILRLSYVNRKTNLMPQILLVLAVAPGTGETVTDPASPWGLLIVQAILAQVYLSAAICKLVHSGVRWADGSVLQAVFLGQHLSYDLPLTEWLARHRWLCSGLAAATLLHQLTFWLVLVVPGLWLPYAMFGLLFHVATLVLMRINYLTYQAPAFLVFVAAPLARMLADAGG